MQNSNDRSGLDDPLTDGELKFLAMMRDRKRWAAWCAGRRAAWLAKHPNWRAERETRDKKGVKQKAK